MQQEQIASQLENNEFSAPPQVVKGKYRENGQKNGGSINVNIHKPKRTNNNEKNQSQSIKNSQQIQAAVYEELDGPIDQNPQLDFYLDRPPTPIYVPQEKGKDKNTQIDKGDLFDYDVEVEPIIQILIGRTVELSRIEILEEDQIKELQTNRQKYEQKRNAELMKCQRMANRQARRDQEVTRRQIQYGLQNSNAVKKQKKQIIGVVKDKYLQNGVMNMVNMLEQAGVLKDSLKQEIETDYMAGLMDQVNDLVTNASNIDQQILSQNQEVESIYKKKHQDTIDKENKRRAAILLDRSNKAFLKNYKENLKKQKKEAQEEENIRNMIYQQIESNILNKKSLIEQNQLLEQSVQRVDNINAISRIIMMLNDLQTEFLVNLGLMQQVSEKQYTKAQLTQILMNFIQKIKQPLIVNVESNELHEQLMQDIQKNSEEAEQFAEIRQERIEYYHSQLQMMNLTNLDSCVDGMKEIEQTLLEIMIECSLQQRDDDFKDRVSYVQKSRQEMKEESESNLTDVNYIVMIQPKREFKQEESLNANNQSQSNNNRSITQNQQDQQKSEYQEEVIEQKEESVKEEQQEQVPTEFKNNQELLDYHVNQIRKKYLYDENDEFTDIEQFDGRTYLKKCEQIPEQEMGLWEPFVINLMKIANNTVLLVDNRSNILIQQQMSLFTAENQSEYQQLHPSLIEKYRQINQKLQKQWLDKLRQINGRLIIYDYDE